MDPSQQTENQNQQQDEQKQEQEKRRRELNLQRRKQISDETAMLVQLTTELKTEVDNTDKDTLSLTVIRKAEDIEKLAHAVRENMKVAVKNEGGRFSGLACRVCSLDEVSKTWGGSPWGSRVLLPPRGQFGLGLDHSEFNKTFDQIP